MKLPSTRVGRFNIVKTSNLSKLIYRFNAFPFKFLACFHGVNWDKLILKFIWNYEGSRISKTTLKLEEHVGVLSPLTVRYLKWCGVSFKKTNPILNLNITILQQWVTCFCFWHYILYILLCHVSSELMRKRER
jgi:hypothetical protein